MIKTKEDADQYLKEGLLSERGYEIILHELTWKEINEEKKNDKKNK